MNAPLFRNRYRIPSTRLRGWDYASPSFYFVTICVKNRVPCLSEIVNGEMHLSPIGEIVAEEWQRTTRVRANVVLDAWVVMPNHLHGIIGITASDASEARRGKMIVVETSRRGISTTTGVTAAASAAWKSNSLGAIIGQFKSVCTKRIWAAGHRDFALQSRFYDHIARNEAELEHIRRYILANPSRWEEDRENVEALYM
ncbi:MAG TPA: hypothetical protein VNK49_09095 [Anaerolineales bacterium]|nr:hypothetical protein [Anaerolineales bacterium]